MNRLFVLGAFLLCTITSVFGAIQYAPKVKLTSGELQGLAYKVEGQGVLLYEGIRYGQAKRFEKPTPATPWSGLYNATAYRSACPQSYLKSSNGLFNETDTMSEDCLFLNVWTPAVGSGNRSVMVWIHGGGFQRGHIFTDYYNASGIVRQGNVVVVTINYRLGAFGFLFGGTKDAPGNAGLHDQILALKWVQANIGHFGGDAHKVTVFGESAGGVAVASLVLSPLAKGLFNRAIIQSGTPNTFYGSENVTSALNMTKRLATQLHCQAEHMVDTLACLRNKTVDQILAADEIVKTQSTQADVKPRKIFLPVFGDELLPLEPVSALKSGNFNHNIDIMYGVVEDEGASFVVDHLPQLLNDSAVVTLESAKKDIKFVMQKFGVKFGSEVADFYATTLKGKSSKDDLRHLVATAFSDFYITCPTILFAQQYAKLSPRNKFYSYRFSQSLGHPATGCTRSWMGVCHGEDVIFLFVLSNKQLAAKYPFKAEAHQASEDMVAAWTEFAKSGHVSHRFGGEHLKWPEAFVSPASYSVTTHMQLNAQHYMSEIGHYRRTCDEFWKPRIF